MCLLLRKTERRGRVVRELRMRFRTRWVRRFRRLIMSIWIVMASPIPANQKVRRMLLAVNTTFCKGGGDRGSGSAAGQGLARLSPNDLVLITDSLALIGL